MASSAQPEWNEDRQQRRQEQHLSQIQQQGQKQGCPIALPEVCQDLLESAPPCSLIRLLAAKCRTTALQNNAPAGHKERAFAHQSKDVNAPIQAALSEAQNSNVYVEVGLPMKVASAALSSDLSEDPESPKCVSADCVSERSASSTHSKDTQATKDLLRMAMHTECNNMKNRFLTSDTQCSLTAELEALQAENVRIRQESAALQARRADGQTSAEDPVVELTVASHPIASSSGSAVSDPSCAACSSQDLESCSLANQPGSDSVPNVSDDAWAKFHARRTSKQAAKTKRKSSYGDFLKSMRD